MDLAGLGRLFKRLAIHPGERQNPAARRFLGDRRDESIVSPVHLIKPIFRHAIRLLCRA
jgi:hypothetical protein